MKTGHQDGKTEPASNATVWDFDRMGWFTLLFTLPFLGYLLFIKKYLRKN